MNLKVLYIFGVLSLLMGTVYLVGGNTSTSTMWIVLGIGFLFVTGAGAWRQRGR